jgi:hypothetical protein
MAGPASAQPGRISHNDLVARLKALNDEGRHADVLAFGQKNLAVVKGSPAILSALADAATALGQAGQAEALRRQVLALEPGHASTANNLAVLLIRRGALDEAEALVRSLLERESDHIEARYNLALILQRRGLLEDAVEQARAVLARRPEHERSPYLISQSLLVLGRYAEAWPYYEARTLPANAAGSIYLPPFAYPAWRGEPLAAKSIVIWMEQGLGDEIMMARYPAMLKAMGATQVTWVCKPAMTPLLRRADGIDTLLAAEGRLNVPTHDYWTLPMSMPGGCGTTLDTIPSTFPYIGVDPAARARATALLDDGRPGLKVGLAWKGNAALSNDANRSLPGLAALAPLWSVAGARFFSLQKGQAEDEAAAPPPGQPLVALGPHLTDFGETAAVIEQLDLVVSVDTAVAHLAGALGKPASVLLPATATDWRWGRERADSPWYPSLTLYRQPTPGDWRAAIAAVAADLAARAA